MIDALYIAATGLRSSQTQVDTISNNMANLNTPAFKRGRVSFAELVNVDAATSVHQASLERGRGASGLGASVAAITRDFSPGELKATGNAMDLAINGVGFLEVELPDGSLGYTRDAALEISAEGFLQTVNGHPLSRRIQVPVGTVELRIASDGAVTARLAGEAEGDSIGMIDLANFVNPSALAARGEGLYVATPDAGAVYYSEAGRDGLGDLRQGFLESGNVDLVTELMELVVAQRSYQVNSQVVRVSDELMQITNSLKD